MLELFLRIAIDDDPDGRFGLEALLEAGIVFHEKDGRMGDAGKGLHLRRIGPDHAAAEHRLPGLAVAPQRRLHLSQRRRRPGAFVARRDQRTGPGSADEKSGGEQRHPGVRQEPRVPAGSRRAPDLQRLLVCAILPAPRLPLRPPDRPEESQSHSQQQLHFPGNLPGPDEAEEEENHPIEHCARPKTAQQTDRHRFSRQQPRRQQQQRQERFEKILGVKTARGRLEEIGQHQDHQPQPEEPSERLPICHSPAPAPQAAQRRGEDEERKKQRVPPGDDGVDRVLVKDAEAAAVGHPLFRRQDAQGVRQPVPDNVEGVDLRKKQLAAAQGRPIIPGGEQTEAEIAGGVQSQQPPAPREPLPRRQQQEEGRGQRHVERRLPHIVSQSGEDAAENVERPEAGIAPGAQQQPGAQSAKQHGQQLGFDHCRPDQGEGQEEVEGRRQPGAQRIVEGARHQPDQPADAE